MKWIITNWDGKNNFSITIEMTLFEHIDGMGEIYKQEMRKGMRAQGIIK